MEGNECYKYSTIGRFVSATNAPPIRCIVDIGVNIGDTIVLANSYFPAARIIGYEPVEEYFHQAQNRTKHLSHVIIRHAACTGQHKYSDDLGTKRRKCEQKLRLYKALPASGPGWLGGSKIDSIEDHSLVDDGWEGCYELCSARVTARTLKELFEYERLSEIDILKIDCEGCEFSLLGTAPLDCLRRVRFICGEYHNVERFYVIMREHLYQSHKVCIVGGRYQGCFFAERLDGTQNGILHFDRSGMFRSRAEFGPTPLDWNPFNQIYIPDSERRAHGLDRPAD